MNIKLWNILLVGGLIGAFCAGGYVFYLDKKEKEAVIAATEKKVQEEALLKAEQAKKDQEIKTRFETFLNVFLKNLSDNVGRYKKNRTVLKQIMVPENLKNPEYLAENAKLLESTVQTLQAQMDTIMGLFKKADTEIEPLLKKLSDKEQNPARAQWKKIQDNQAMSFMAYFTSEQDILSAHQALMVFYLQHRQSLKKNEETGEMEFSSPDDIQTVQKLENDIANLIEAQTALLKKPDEENTEERVEEDGPP